MIGFFINVITKKLTVVIFEFCPFWPKRGRFRLLIGTPKNGCSKKYHKHPLMIMYISIDILVYFNNMFVFREVYWALLQ